ncbi:TM2 domain-containing protein [Deinococcus planocerae]|uniref:TM2 domain-containing protein n=1 Tax=Deinococcus planocerae TaxID=1737569 RepID=UPI000C7F21A4|nr:NINE protein [Deinococcus planocerae]
MTKPEDPTPGHEPTPKSSVPSWVDEVLSAQPKPQPVNLSTPPQAEGDLRIPEASGPQPAPTPSPAEGSGDLRIPETPRPQPAPTVVTATARPHADEDDWIARSTGNAARNPTVPTGPQVVPPPTGGLQEWFQPTRSSDSAAPSSVPADIAQKRLIAGLLGIVFGSLGVHKFYLGMNTPGLIMLGANIGVWILAFLLGLITLGLGLIITVPLAGLISGAIGLLGLVEGILYLTKSDEEFYGQYVLGKKPWL